jgi:hypothetical protein
MKFGKQIATLGLAMVIGLGLCPASKAQVSCSPKVPVMKCKEVAKFLELLLKLKTGPGGATLELVSPAEYRARVDRMKKDLLLGPVETLGCAPGSKKLVFQNCAAIDVLFLRESSSDEVPKHILASSYAATDVLMLSYFIQGYYEGLIAGMAESQNKK